MTAKILIPIATATVLGAGSFDKASAAASTLALYSQATERKPQSLLQPALDTADAARRA